MADPSKEILPCSSRTDSTSSTADPCFKYSPPEALQSLEDLQASAALERQRLEEFCAVWQQRLHLLEDCAEADAARVAVGQAHLLLSKRLPQFERSLLAVWPGQDEAAKKKERQHGQVAKEEEGQVNRRRITLNDLNALWDVAKAQIDRVDAAFAFLDR
jgi:hypothetical protein